MTKLVAYIWLTDDDNDDVLMMFLLIIMQSAREGISIEEYSLNDRKYL